MKFNIVFLGNIAVGKQASQSSVILKHVPNLAVDGRLDGNCSQTNYEENPWWRVDLQNDHYIMAIVILNCCNSVMENVEVRVGSNENREMNKICGHIDVVNSKENAVLLCSSDLSGRYVHLNVRGKNKSLSICEVRIYGALGNTLFISFCDIQNFFTLPYLSSGFPSSHVKSS